MGIDWFTVRTPNPYRRNARGRVYCLRGQGILFSGGLAAICNHLRQDGFHTEDLRCMGDWWVVQQIQQFKKQGGVTGPIVLVGHSAGGRAALHAAQSLMAFKIVVELLICIDVAFPPCVPVNVRRALNLFRSQRRFYPAAPLLAAPDSPSIIQNIDFDSPDSPIREPGINHLNITNSPGVQALILETIRSLG